MRQTTVYNNARPGGQWNPPIHPAFP
jgi:hypothetical protein